MSQPSSPPSTDHAESRSPLSRSSRPEPAPLKGPESPCPWSPSRPSLSSRQPLHATFQESSLPAPRDLGQLLRPELYHALPPAQLPPSFRDSSRQPDSSWSIDTLLARGHFRAAAIASVQQLTSTDIDSHNAPHIFSLLYTRLACLSLVDNSGIAALEAKSLGDLNEYIDAETGACLAPWHLRVLHARLYALGLGEPRRVIMGYYDLVREARTEYTRAGGDEELRAQWASRICDLGVRVATALVDMGDLVGAKLHLESLRGCHKEVVLAEALLSLWLGDVKQASLCAERAADATQQQLILALCEMADADYDAALAKWEKLRESLAGDEMAGVNTAVCLIYLGRMHEGRDILEKLVNAGFCSQTLLFNLATVYELCTERHAALKTRLAERVAANNESPEGWERVNADFKL
ncbi:hypothetical protein CDD81_3458 [Ophiocordyceps australis]|uniref:MalT-like TPR region domain-containing protein n=1 Tax=Ophiocordyceps australis TaxID=1399860 RepID=A0A2C5YC65_9HYPO|nr:hypothetical protein CDD81_3458 [Ophiocordyceps australis]